MILLDQFRNDARQVHEIFDYLGREGVLFEKTITYAPYTLASVHATFTGMYGRNNGVDAYTKADQYDEKNCMTLAEYLYEVDYYTRGYSFSSILLPAAGFSSLKIVPEQEETDSLGHHLEEIETCFQQKKPFFCYLHYGDIHHDVLREVIRKYGDFDPQYFEHYQQNRERYLGYAKQAGDYTAKLIQKIESLDKNQNTIIILLTDHGSSNGERPGEKAYGIYTYDYSICVWCYFIWPKRLPRGIVIDSQIRTIDILPTLLELLEIKPKKKKKLIQGKSLLPIILGVEAGDRLAFSETGGVDGPTPSPSEPNIKCIRDGEWKLIYNTTTNHFEMYHLKTDPIEKNNLYTKEPRKAEELWKKLTEHL